MVKRSPFSQVTLKAVKERINEVAASELEDRLKNISNYAVVISPVDTGAYVESFSMGRAGFGGGRSRKSEARQTGVKKGGGGANPESFRETARGQLYEDIEGMDIAQMIESGNVKFTLRNRAPHANDVENGESWDRDGYHVFAKIRNRFG
jgi:hypothetical protein